jgi:DNA N-6-adenine-methyltransferase (Dam)
MTPVEIIKAGRHVLGLIDLDPASSEQAQKRIRAKRYCTVQDDALAKPWHSTVFLNPPYSRGHIERFVLRSS